MSEYEYEYYSVLRKWPNTNTNDIRSSDNDQIQIRIYYSVFQKRPNMNNIRSAENNRLWIRITFGLLKMIEYESKRTKKYIGCICLIYLHCVFSNVSSNCLSERIQKCIGYICLIFLYCGLHLFDFSTECVFNMCPQGIVAFFAFIRFSPTNPLIHSTNLFHQTIKFHQKMIKPQISEW